MPFHRSTHPSWILLVVACQYGGEASTGGQVDLGDSSSFTASPSPPTTSAAPTTSPTSTTSTTSTQTSTSTGTSEGTTSTGDTGGEPVSSTGDIPSPSCGDAQLDPGEECDLGLIENSNTGPGACTLECKLAKCGDGLIWAGKEACDNGPNNNDELYAGCTTQCTLGPTCNDGQLQGPEECDLGADNGTGEVPNSGVPCDNGCRFQARLVFLSSVAYKGGELGGVEGAHLKCQNLAKQAKFDNAAKFMAWISDAQHSPFQDFAHGPETVGLAYVRPDGVRIADDWDDLILNGPGDGIIVTETGEMTLNRSVWTGTAPSGKAFDPVAHCKSWSSSSPADNSRRGRSGIDKQQVQAWTQWSVGKHWTSVLSDGCDVSFRLYCFEQ